jgi:hypothetical protein
LTRKGVTVTERDQDGRPRTAFGPDQESLQALVKQSVKPNSKVIFNEELPTNETVVIRKQALLSPHMEVSALKCGLLTFDHLLRNTASRFTRGTGLQLVREFVCDTITTGKIDPHKFGKFSLGLQYGKIGLYKGIREQVKFEKTPFEHFMIASANYATHSLDLVWLVAGFDPFGFRLADDWMGESFTFTFVNGILNETRCSDAIYLPQSYVLCDPTLRRSFPEIESTQETVAEEANSALQKAIGDVSGARRTALCNAVHLVETTSDEYVIQGMAQRAMLLEENQRNMPAVINERLKRLFGDRSQSKEFASLLSTLFKDETSNLPFFPSGQRINSKRGDGVDWPQWLRVYRNILTKLEEKYGLVGYAMGFGTELKDGGIKIHEIQK